MQPASPQGPHAPAAGGSASIDPKTGETWLSLPPVQLFEGSAILHQGAAHCSPDSAECGHLDIEFQLHAASFCEFGSSKQRLLPFPGNPQFAEENESLRQAQLRVLVNGRSPDPQTAVLAGQLHYLTCDLLRSTGMTSQPNSPWDDEHYKHCTPSLSISGTFGIIDAIFATEGCIQGIGEWRSRAPEQIELIGVPASGMHELLLTVLPPGAGLLEHAPHVDAHRILSSLVEKITLEASLLYQANAEAGRAE